MLSRSEISPGRASIPYTRSANNRLATATPVVLMIVRMGPSSFRAFISKTHPGNRFRSAGARAKPAEPGRCSWAADPCGSSPVSGISHPARCPAIRRAATIVGARVGPAAESPVRRAAASRQSSKKTARVVTAPLRTDSQMLYESGPESEEEVGLGDRPIYLEPCAGRTAARGLSSSAVEEAGAPVGDE
jgi:hypothetical protein